MRFSTSAALAATVFVLLFPAACLPTRSERAVRSATHIRERLEAAERALHWLNTRQNADGGFGEPSSDPVITCEVVLAFSSAYEEPHSVQQGGNSPLDYLKAQAPMLASSAKGTALLILAVVAGSQDPADFSGTDLTSLLDGYYDSASGRYHETASDGIAAQALAMMAKTVSRQAVPPKAITWLKQRQNDDGGWGRLPGRASDTKHTALAVQALVAAQETPDSQPVRNAVEYLEKRQRDDGGFAGSDSIPISDPRSTAQAIQALLAAGEDLLSAKWHRSQSTPFDALLSDQAEDGSFADTMGASAAAVPGLLGRTLPLPGRYLAAVKGLEWLHTQQEDDGGFGNGGFTADAVLAIALCGQHAGGAEWAHPATKKTPLQALEAQTPDYLTGAPPGGPAGELSKVIRAVESAGADPYSFAGMDLVEQLKALCDQYSPRCHPHKVFSHSLALLALDAVGESIPVQAVTVLEDEQLAEGGWPWAWGESTADVDTTGLSLQAIIAGGGPHSPEVINDFAAFLESVRFTSGAYPDVASRPDSNCNSTGLAIEGLVAAGRYRNEPLIIPLETGALASSWDALLAFQEPSGSFAFTTSSPGSRLVATLEAIRVLASPVYPDYKPVIEGDG